MTGAAPRFSHRTPLMPGDEVGTWAREALLRMDADFCLALTAAIHRSENTGAQYRFKTAFAGFDNCSLAAQRRVLHTICQERSLGTCGFASQIGRIDPLRQRKAIVFAPPPCSRQERNGMCGTRSAVNL